MVQSLIPIALLTDSLKANLRRTFKPFLVLSLLAFRWICNQTKSSQQFSVICTCTAQSLARNVTFVAVFLSRTFPGNIVEIFFHFEHYLTPLWNRKTSIMSTRKASHAGSWYTSDGGRTCSQILLFWKMRRVGIGKTGVFKSFVVFSSPSSKCSTETERKARRVVI